MGRIIKFAWDYYGEPAGKTAEHHSIHLKEFAEGRELDLRETGWENLKANRAIAYILLKEEDAIEFKDILRPHRAWIEQEMD